MLTKNQKILLDRIEVENERFIGRVTHCKKPMPEPKVFGQQWVQDCYLHPSQAKMRAEQFINMFMTALNIRDEIYAHNYTITGYNVCTFSAIFLVRDRKTDKNICYYYFTKDNTRRYEIL